MAAQDSLRNRSWRPQQLFGEQARLRRRWRRIFVSCLLLGLFAAFLMAVARPMVHVNTSVLFLNANVNQNPGYYGTPYGEETFAALDPLIPALYRSDDKPGRPERLPQMTSAQAAPTILASLHQQKTSSDAVVLFISADGLVIDGEPHVLCGNFDPLRPRSGAISVRTLLGELRDRRAAVKFVVLDTGYAGQRLDPRLGRIVDDFIYELESVVKQNNDDNLWVLTSHSSHQTPHVSPALRRTVFSYFVTEGMRGAADTNLDQQVSVSELHRFVDLHVAQWVRLATDGRHDQTPRLMHADDQRVADGAADTLLSVERIDPALRSLDLEAALALADVHRGALPPVEPDLIEFPPFVDQLPSLPQDSEDPRQRQRGWHEFLAMFSSGPPSSPEKADADGEKDQEQPAEGNPNGKSDESADPAAGEGEDAAEPAVDRRVVDLHIERATLIQQLLGWRDTIRADPHTHAELLQRAPHLWREFETRLQVAWIALDEQAAASDDTRYEELRRLAPTIKALAQRRSPPAARRGLSRRFSEAWEQIETLPTTRNSAPPKNLAEALRRSPSVVELQTARQFDEWIEQKTAPDFAEALKQLPAETLELQEFQLLQQLAERNDQPWLQRRTALEALRLANQVAEFGRGATAWIAHLVELGDMYRDQGTHALLTAVDGPQSQRAHEKLVTACEFYLDAADAIQTVEVARLVSHRCLYEIPAWLGWSYDSLAASPNQSTPPARLRELLNHVEHLAKRLDREDPTTIDELQSALDLTIRQVRMVSTAMSHESLEYLSNSRLASDRVGINALAGSTVVGAAVAKQLSDNRLRMDRALASNFAPPSSQTTLDTEESATQRRWEAYREIAQVAVQLVDFAGRVSNKDPANTATEPSKLTTAMIAFESSIERREDEDERLQAASHLETTLKQELADLPALIDSRSTADGQLSLLHAAQRALLVIDPRDASRLTMALPSFHIAQRREFRFWTWRYRRTMISQAFADESQQQRLAGEANHAALMAAEFSSSMPLADDRPRVEVTAPESIDWLEGDAAPVQLSINNQDSSQVYIWVVAEFDQSKLAIQASPESTGLKLPLPIYTLRSTDSELLLRIDSPPTVRMERGTTRLLEIPLQVLSSTAGSSPLRLRLIASRRRQIADVASNASWITTQPSNLLRQQVIPILVDNTYLARRTWVGAPAQPDVVFHIHGPDNGVIPRPDGFRLLAFPNRDTEFRFSISTNSPRTKKVSVRFVTPQHPPANLPRGSVLRKQAASLLQEMGTLTNLVPPLAVDLSGPGIATPLPLPKMEPAEPDAPPRANIPRTFIAIVETEGSDHVLIRQFQIEVQHPRRYTVADARYDVKRQRIEIEVRDRANAARPAKAIPLAASIDSPLSAGPSSRLASMLEVGGVASLHLDVPRTPGRVATVRLDVDGYPRAFTFRVACDADAEADELDQLRAVTVVAPVKLKSFAAPATKIPARIRVDAPNGAFALPGNYVEVGIDQDMDRDFHGDRTIKLFADRNVTASLSSSAPDGLIGIAAVVDDFQLEIPADGIQNRRVNLLAQLRLGRVVAQDAAEEVWLDGLPPRVVVQDVEPGRIVPIGSPLVLTVDCVDDEFGFVSKFEAAFDTKGLGKFDPETPPVEGKVVDGNRWSVSLPTDALQPGRHLLLFRAVDHVGNAGVYGTMRVTLVKPPPEDAAMLGRLSGIARYRLEPAEGATLLLEPLDKTVKLPQDEAESNDQGAFVFNELPPGKYTLTARLLRRNRRLKLEQEVEIAVPPAPASFVELNFK